MGSQGYRVIFKQLTRLVRAVVEGKDSQKVPVTLRPPAGVSSMRTGQLATGAKPSNGNWMRSDQTYMQKKLKSLLACSQLDVVTTSSQNLSFTALHVKLTEALALPQRNHNK